MIDVDKAFALLGISGSGQSIAVMPVLEKSGIPTVIDVGAGQVPLGTTAQERVRRRTSPMRKASSSSSNILREKNPGKKWGLITQDDDYGITVRDGFDTVVKDRKLNVVYSGNYKKGQQDFSSDMLQLKDSGAEVFLAGGIIGENIAMMKELEKLNIKPVVGIFWPGRVEAGAETDGTGRRRHLRGRLCRAVRRPRRQGLPRKGKGTAAGSRDQGHQPLHHDRLCRRQGH